MIRSWPEAVAYATCKPWSRFGRNFVSSHWCLRDRLGWEVPSSHGPVSHSCYNPQPSRPRGLVQKKCETGSGMWDPEPSLLPETVLKPRSLKLEMISRSSVFLKFFFKFIFTCLKGRVIETHRDLLFASSSPQMLATSGVWNSIQVSHGGSRDLTAWVVTCCLSWCAVQEGGARSRARTQTWVVSYGVCISQVLSNICSECLSPGVTWIMSQLRAFCGLSQCLVWCLS